MKNELLSVVIVAWRRGFVAHIRFADPLADADISANNKYGMDTSIDRYLRGKGVRV